MSRYQPTSFITIIIKSLNKFLFLINSKMNKYICYEVSGSEKKTI